MISVWDVSALFEEEVLRRYVPFLDDERRMQMERYRAAEDRARCVGAGILLAESYRQFQMKKDRELAAADSLLVLSESDVNWLPAQFFPDKKTALPSIMRKEHGKPCFVDEGEPFFSLSHAGDYVACYLGIRDMAIDIECIRKKKDAVMKRVFSDAESDMIEKLEKQEGVEAADRLFTELWTKKEAMSKLDGRGIAFLYEKEGQKETPQMNTQSIWISQKSVLSVAQWL